MAHAVYRFEFADGSAELVAHGSVRYHELLEDGHAPAGEVPGDDGISDALSGYLDTRIAEGAASDASVAALVQDPESATGSALTATFGRVGANTARFVQRARAGENLTITALGDSILEGQTVTNPATDGAMILLADDLSARFGVTVTQTNHASSGYTALRAHVNGNVADAIAEDADLYVVSAFDKNDLGQDINGQWAPGYNLAASTASVERIVRTIRSEVPKADIILLGTNPYTEGSSSNAYQQAKIDATRRIAATYGCEFVDAYQAFVDEGDYSDLMADSTHPNTAGHRVIADTLLAHLPDVARAPHAVGEPGRFGLHSPELVDTSAINYGYLLAASPTTQNGITYATGGAGWNGEITTTVGDYVEVSADCTELAIQISTTTSDNAVVDIALDGVTQASAVNLSEQGKNGQYWVPFFTGLTPGAHTLRLTLVSGVLRPTAVAALASGQAAFEPDERFIVLGEDTATPTIDNTGAYTTLTTAQIDLPNGWSEMRVEFIGTANVRTTGATTGPRWVHLNIDYSPGHTDHYLILPTDSAGDKFTSSERFTRPVLGVTTSALAAFRARVLSSTKTNVGLGTGGYTLYARLTRTA